MAYTDIPEGLIVSGQDKSEESVGMKHQSQLTGIFPTPSFLPSCLFHLTVLPRWTCTWT